MRNMDKSFKGYAWQGDIGEGAFATVSLWMGMKDKRLYAAKSMHFGANRRLKWEAENEIEVRIIFE